MVTQMRRSISVIACSLMLANLTVEAALAEPDFAGCPPLLETKQKLVGDYPGWTATDTTSTRVFGGIGITEHNPNDKGDLKPAQLVFGNNRSYSYWDIIEGGDYWLRCGYEGFSVYLAKPVPKGKTICFEEDNRDSLVFAVCR
jgi:hypothetical protein